MPSVGTGGASMLSFFGAFGSVVGFSASALGDWPLPTATVALRFSGGLPASMRFRRLPDHLAQRHPERATSHGQRGSRLIFVAGRPLATSIRRAGCAWRRASRSTVCRTSRRYQSHDVPRQIHLIHGAIIAYHQAVIRCCLAWQCCQCTRRCRLRNIGAGDGADIPVWAGCRKLVF